LPPFAATAISRQPISPPAFARRDLPPYDFAPTLSLRFRRRRHAAIRFAFAATLPPPERLRCRHAAMMRALQRRCAAFAYAHATLFAAISCRR